MNMVNQERKARKRAGDWQDGRTLRRKPAEERKAGRAIWMAQHVDEAREYQKVYRQEKKRELQVKRIVYYKQIRLDGIAEYGGRCACCGEARHEFLTLEHINGRSDETVRKTGQKAWSRLKTLGWPKDGYQVLCFNCNCAKGIYGVCPHQGEPR